MNPGSEINDNAEPGPRVEEVAQFGPMVEDGAVQAWEEVDTGRYMPRRIKGSCIGRALG
jgi:hypothetical protein